MSAFDNVEFIKASAGSGKTYSLMERVEYLVITERMPVASILATTFTVKAANELKSRIRRKLLEANRADEAQQVEDSLIGTVDSVCGRLLADYAIDAGENPSMTVLPEENVAEFFNRALRETIAAHQDVMAPFAERLAFGDGSWLKVVQDLIDAARSNCMDGVKLELAKEKSIAAARKIYDGTDETLTLVGVKSELQPYWNDIKEVAEAFVREGTQAKQTFGGGLCDFCAMAFEYEGTSWKMLRSLSNTRPSAQKTTKPALRDKLIEIQKSLADRLLHAKELQQDVVRFISEIFAIAQEGLDKFQAYKREFGLVDFVDQETKILKLLTSGQSETFRKAIKDRIKVVMVDEFQDTSPLQLAIFLKLNEIVRRSIWVGDPKQSIYSFRGADPSFMAEIMKCVEQADAERVKRGGVSLIHVLPYSWRSRENLVEFANEVFTRTFSNTPIGDVKLGISPDEKGKAERKGGRLSVWQKKAPYNYGREALSADFASRVRQFFEGEHPHLNRYGDLAILLRTNSECFKMSAALQLAGLPVSIGGGQLKDEPIAYLGMCAYRRAFSLKDTIAGEVLRRYVPGVNLDAVADVEQNLTPLELLEKAIVAYGVEDYVRRGANREYGLATLEALRDLCREYMADCSLRGVPAVQAGFIRYFVEAEKEGASATGGDCIQVMTYHKAKGLEWPVVILCSLGEIPKGSPFGVRIFQHGAFDPADPLLNRMLQYIPAPFGAKHKDEIVPFVNQGISEFDRQHREVLSIEMDEARRLMYVGVTRAQDEVIFFAKKQTSKNIPDGEPKIAWLDVLTETSLFKENFLKNEARAKWNIGNCTREFEVEMELLPEIGEGDYKISAGGWSDIVLAGAACRRPSFRVSPSSMEGVDVGAVIGEKIDIGSSMGVTIFSRPSELGDCVHAYMAVSVPAKDASMALAEGVIARWQMADVLDVDKLVQAGNRLSSLIEERWPRAIVHTEVPMSVVLPSGQVSEGFVDMLLETEKGYVIIDHKMLRSLDEEKARADYGIQLQCYKMAVEAATGKKVLQTFLHLPNQGVCLELKTGAVDAIKEALGKDCIQ